MSSGGDAMTEDLGLEGGDGSGISSSGRCSGEEGSCSGVGEVGRELSGAVEVEEEGENWEDMNRGGNKKERKIPMKLARAARLAGVKKGAEGAEDGTRTETMGGEKRDGGLGTAGRGRKVRAEHEEVGGTRTRKVGKI